MNKFLQNLRGNPKVNLRLNSWILRCAQYDKKSVQYDKIYKYEGKPV